MEKIEIYKFLDSLIEHVPSDEWQYVEMLIRKKGDHWEIELYGDKMKVVEVKKHLK